MLKSSLFVQPSGAFTVKMSPLMVGPLAAGAFVGVSSVGEDVPEADPPEVGSLSESWQPASARHTAIDATVP